MVIIPVCKLNTVLLLVFNMYKWTVLNHIVYCVSFFTETKSNIPTLHLVSKIMTLLEDMAGSEHLKYLRIVDLVVNESKFDRLKAGI